MEQTSSSGQQSAGSDATLSSSLTVSTTFFWENELRDQPPDLVLISADSVYFYAHSTVLLSSSSNKFGGVLPSRPSYESIAITAQSDILNLILHTAYGLSCSPFSPTFKQLKVAVNAMHSFGFYLSFLVVPDHPLYEILLTFASQCPLDLYVLAASHDMFTLAAATSPHLLSIKIDSIADKDAQEMGSVYFKRLVNLHATRVDAHQHLLSRSPSCHEETTTCGTPELQRLGRIWAYAIALLSWEIRPDISIFAIRSSLQPLEKKISCDRCVQNLRECIESIASDWAKVQLTI